MGGLIARLEGCLLRPMWRQASGVRRDSRSPASRPRPAARRILVATATPDCAPARPGWRQAWHGSTSSCRCHAAASSIAGQWMLPEQKYSVLSGAISTCSSSRRNIARPPHCSISPSTATNTGNSRPAQRGPAWHGSGCRRTVQRMGGSCHPGKHRFWICERLKSVAEPQSELPVVDRTADLEQEIGASPGVRTDRSRCAVTDQGCRPEKRSGHRRSEAEWLPASNGPPK